MRMRDKSNSSDTIETRILPVMLSMLVILMLAAAVGRHLLPDAHGHILRLASGCLAWTASLGMARAAAAGVHVRISVVADAVSPEVRLRLSLIADGIFLLFSLATLLIGCYVLAVSLARADLPGHPSIYASLPVGGGLTALRLVQRIRRVLRGGGA